MLEYIITLFKDSCAFGMIFISHLSATFPMHIKLTVFWFEKVFLEECKVFSSLSYIIDFFWLSVI